ncbi:hypothetical protein MSLAZ_1526 [Methanosarcina lacustris Z-7289]|uniref:Uncharacterized protein n=1 Tax=Methanosarcina lacustris Z-7289 TaxID=1434111 RepID=A0A0E3S695_9EURY|nr:hypothetical protein [Methanosarcina lacustris]AKB74787.1 hypothetical protein MSLAZ_1526 [Methanosarcina lacustris Z-7289]
MKEDNTQSEKFSLHERLRSLNTTEFYDLLSRLLVKKPELYQLVLEWFKEKQESTPETMTDNDIVSLNDNLLFEYWEDARSIISEFNELGGGPEEEEEEAFGYLEKISGLIEEGGLSTAAKLEFLDEAFEEYNIKNSGFEDGLMEIFFDICQTKEEWEYLVKKLDEYPSEWRKERIMIIHRKYLHDDEAYLQERMQALIFGMDYWDLVKFYVEKGDLEKALERAEEGVLKGEGRLTELFEFLWEHFSKKEDTAILERLVHTALSRNTEEKHMLDRLFEYYRAKGDYEHAKDALLRSFEFARQQYYAEYTRMKGFLKASDWKSIEPEIFSKIKEKDFHDYLRICLDKGMKKTVLKSIFNPPKNRFGYSIEVDFDEFADKLANDFPDKIIEYYWQKAYRNIPNGNRKTYSIAVKYLGKVKDVYIDILNNEADWVKRFSELKSEFKKRPAFLEITSEL